MNISISDIRCYEYFYGWGRGKNKANIKRSKIDFTYNTEDCHGPSGLAMTEKEFEKTKPICRALAGNPKHEALNPKQRHF